MVLVFLVLLIYGCQKNITSDVDKNLIVEPKRVVDGLTVGNAMISAIALVKDNLAVMYTNNNKLRFRSGSRKFLLDEAGGYTANNLWLVSKGKFVYAFWWQKYVYDNKHKKIRGKSLFVRGSNDYGKTFYPKVLVNTDEGVLPDLEIVADDLGHVSVIYNDERLPAYEVYINSSSDGGKTWLDKDIRLDKVFGQEVKSVAANAGTPHLAYVDNKLIAVWQQFDKNNGKPITRLLSKESSDNGVSWGEEKVVYKQSGDVASTLDILNAGKELYLFWFDRKKKGLVLFSRNTDGKWKENTEIAPGTKDAFAISWLKGVSDNNNLYIAFTHEKKPYKSYVSFIKFNRKSFKWFPNVVRLDQHKPSVKYVAKSWNSDIAMLPNGQVLVAWEDYEDIVPGIHINYLDTKNNTWQKTKKRLVKPGIVDARSPKIIVSDNNQIFIVFYYAEMKETGHAPVTELGYLSYRYDKSGLLIKSIDGKVPEVSVSKNIIKKKVKELWEARLANDREAEWKLLDPVYRIKFNKNKWLKSDSGIKFSSFTVDRVTVQGVYAKVEGKVTYKIPEKLMRSKVLDPEDNKNVDPKLPVDSVYSLKYGWFYDDWYFVPELMFMKHIDD